MKGSIGTWLTVLVVFYLLIVVECCLGFPYHWPLGAEPALTSTFAEYRAGSICCQSGHLHSGIDLKTWNRTGYKVYAVDAGYIRRVRVSPWGYGKVLYLRLRDGRTAIYAHLSAFSPEVQRLVEERQESSGKYSVDLYFPPGILKVRRGQLIGYSGESGSGAPHLHFELRDHLNRPLNPLVWGFSLPDTVAPTMVKVSITPLDASSTVDEKHCPVILDLTQIKPRYYYTDRVVAISGRIGLGVKVYDQANGANNRLGIYGLDLYLDDRVWFTVRYNRFSFHQARSAALDRDFGMIRQGLGRFHRLYREVGNGLPFYDINGPHQGVLDTFATGKGEKRVIPPGLHTIRIVAWDTEGNGSTAKLKVLVDDPPELEHLSAIRDSSGVVLEAQATDWDGTIKWVCFEVSTEWGKNWQAVSCDSGGTPKGVYQTKWPHMPQGVVLFRSQALDDLGLRSSPEFAVLKNGSSDPPYQELPKFHCQLHFREDFLELNITCDRVLPHKPMVTVTQTGGKPQTVELDFDGLKSYTGTYSFIPHLDGPVTLSVFGEDLWGNIGRYDTTFVVYTITPEEGGEIYLPREELWVSFDPHGVYKEVFVRIKREPIEPPSDLPQVSPAYTLFPMEVPFAHSARVAIGYSSIEDLEKVGLYVYDAVMGWAYVGKEVDRERGAIWASVSAFGTFALLKDPIPPRIWDLKPSGGHRIKDRRPTLFARVKDRGSGIGSEEDIVMELDGRRLISEYDPEKHTIQYRPRHPLNYGHHVLRVTAKDRAGNQTVLKSSFWVVKYSKGIGNDSPQRRKPYR